MAIAVTEMRCFGFRKEADDTTPYTCLDETRYSVLRTEYPRITSESEAIRTWRELKVAKATSRARHEPDVTFLKGILMKRLLGMWLSTCPTAGACGDEM